MGDLVEVTKTATKVTSNITLILYIQQSTVGVQLAALCYPYCLTLFTMVLQWYYSGTRVPTNNNGTDNGTFFYTPILSYNSSLLDGVARND